MNETDTMMKVFQKDSLFASVNSIDTFYYNAEKMNYTNAKICQISRIHMGTAQEVIAMIIEKGSPFKKFLNAKLIQDTVIFLFK